MVKIIQVYEKNTTDFTKNGRVLQDTLSCFITESLNGSYELEAEHPLDARLKWQELLEGNIVKADGQLFRIYRKQKTLSGIKINARHIFYDLLDNFLEDVRPTNLNGAGALDWILSNTQYTHPFTSMSDVQTVATKYFIRKNPVEAIMGQDGIINNWGGELVRDNFTIKLLQARGSDRGVLVSYGKNILGIEETLDIDGICTRLMPVGKDGLLLSEKYIDSPYINNFPHPKIKPVEFSDCETEETLRNTAQKYMLDNQIDIPLSNYKFDFIELTKTEEYKNYKVLETVNMGDTVTVKHSKLNINLKCKVINVKKNDLTKRIEKVELGSFKQNIASSINNSIQSIKKEIVQVKSDYQNALDNATALITGSKGGNVVIKKDADGHPTEILIMDTTDINTALNVWRWTSGGFGHSSTGFNGPFDTAITADGHIVAAFITGLVVSGEQIKTGIITSTDGKVSIGIDSGTGVNIVGGALNVRNGNNEVVIDGQYNMFKIIASGTLALNFSSGVYETIATITHGLGYKPAFVIYGEDTPDGTSGTLPGFAVENMFDDYLGFRELHCANVTASEFTISYRRALSNQNTSGTLKYKYYLMKEAAI